MSASASADFSYGPTQFSADAVARYCHSCGDTNPIHLNEEASRRMGLSSCIVPGGMLVFFMERAITTHIPQAKIIEVRTRFTTPLSIDCIVSCEGRSVQQGSASDSGAKRLMRLTCRDMARKIVCLGDVWFTMSSNKNDH